MTKAGILLIHLGLVLLILGQLLTDVLAVESTMHLRNGQTKSYSEAQRSFELAVVDVTETDVDKVVAIPSRRLGSGNPIVRPELPFKVRTKTYYANSSLIEVGRHEESAPPGYEPVAVTAGMGSGVWWRELPHETAMDRRDMPSALVELVGPKGSLGTFLVSAFIDRPQRLDHEGRHYELTMRLKRFYKPYQVHLLEFRHDRYPGTEIPKNFSSRVRLLTEAGEDREVLIKMNTPLRFMGETYYQSSFDRDDQGSVLQVVRNPSWLTPYFACVIVSAGLVVQFLTHLVRFARRRMT